MTHTLLERAHLLEALSQTLLAALGGQGRVALVSGEAGLGKTALVNQFARAQAGTVRFLWGACDALATPRPLGPVHDLAGQTGGELLAALRGDAPRPAIFSACLAELQRAASAVILEDVHWADEATLDLLKFLGRRIGRTPSLLVLTYRDDELDTLHPLRGVLGELPRAETTRLPLAPLSAQAVLMLAQTAGYPDRAPALYVSTRGNPFFVTEALAAEAGSVPPTVRDAVLARAARLSAPARAVLNLASLVPGGIEPWLLDRVLQPAPAAVDECVERGMLQPAADTLAFRHELARRAIADTLPPARGRELHAALVAALLAQEAGAAHLPRLVHHAAQAGQAEAVLRFAPEAARQAAGVSAHREAAAHYETALRHAASQPLEQQAGWLEALGYERYLTSQIEAAVQARSAALEIWARLGRPDKQGHNLRWLSRLHWFLGHRDEAERFAMQALSTLAPLPPSADLAMAYSNRAQLHMLAGQVPEALRLGQQAITLAEALGDVEVLAHALNNVGTSELIANYNSTGRAQLERSLSLALAHDLQEHAARAYTNLGAEGVTHRVYANALPNLNNGIAYCQERDLDAWTLYMLAWRARAHLETGRWTEAANDAQLVLESPRGTPIARIPALAVLGLVRARRGDPGVEPLLDEAQRLATGAAEIQRIAPVAAARAEAAWLRGALAERVDEVRAAYQLALTTGVGWHRGELAIWLWRAGEAIAPPLDVAEPYALELGGDWRGAAAAWERLGCPYERALALLGGDGPARRVALEVFESLGAGPAAHKLRRQLSELSPREAARDRFGGLTARERQVAALIAQGKSNREIAAALVVGTRTAETYISRILNKLGFSSRVQIATWALEKGLSDKPPSS